MNKKRFFKLLGLCAGLSLAVGAGVTLSSGAMEVGADDYTEQFSIGSGSVVSGSSYKAHIATVSERGWVITFGGNNSSVGTNSGNRSKCTLTSYSKYAVSPVTTSSTASAFASTTSISDIGKITYTYSGGSNQTNTKVYLLYSSDNSTFSQATLTSGTQGATIESGTAFEFAKTSGYFAVLFEATNSSGNWRIDGVNLTFYKPVAKYTVSYNMSGHGAEPDSETVNDGGKATNPGNPSTEGFVFAGWYKEQECTNAWDFDKDTVTKDTILYAKWIEKFTVSFNLQGHGSTIDDQSIPQGDKVTKPTDPTDDAYDFGGWYKEQDCTNAWDFDNDTISEATALYAKWTIKKYDVTGNITKGSLAVPSQIEHGGSLDVTIKADSGYKVPEDIADIAVTGATLDSYNAETGVLSLTNASGAVTVTATCPAAGQTFPISVSVTGGEYSGDTNITDQGGVASVTIVATGDYKLPTELPEGAVTGADFTYVASTGVISLSNATANVVINVTCVELTSYAIDVSALNASYEGDSSIKESRTATIIFAPDSNYAQPDDVDVTGAVKSWDKETGTLTLSNPTGVTLSNPTGVVSVTYAAEKNKLDYITLSETEGSYILGEDLHKITVTAHYTVAADADVTNSPNLTIEGFDPFTIAEKPNEQVVTFSYTEDKITKTATYKAEVVAASFETITSWELVALADLTVDDVFVIVGNNGKTYAMTNDNGAGSAPAVSAVTIINDKITSTVADNIKWNVSGNSTSGYTFYPNGSTTTWLYCFSNNNGLRVGTGDAKIFSVDDGYLYNDGQSRYIGIYSSQDWRSYTSINSNITGQSFAFYKKVETATGSADLIKLSGSYIGETKYGGESVSLSDFALTTLYNDNSGIKEPMAANLIEGAAFKDGQTTKLVDGDNDIYLTFGGLECKVTVTAEHMEASLVSVTLVQGEGVKKDGYIAYDGASWNLDGLTVHVEWSDEEHDDDLSLADLVAQDEATLDPATPTVGADSFMVEYTYEGGGSSMVIDPKTSTVALDEAVIADYIESLNWTGKSLDNFKSFAGGQLTSEIVSGWTVMPNYASKKDADALSFGTGSNQFTIKIGDKAVNSLPYTWENEDDGQLIYVVVGDIEKGDSKNAKANICPTINAIESIEIIEDAYDEKVDGYTLVTDASTLNAGDKCVIAASDYDYAMSTTQNSNNRGQAAVTKSGSNLSWKDAAVQEFTLEVGTKANTYAFNTGSGYIFAASSNSNHLRTETTKSDNSSFTVTVTSKGVATMVAQGTNTRNMLQYNNSNGIFSCYSGGQKSIAIYKYISTTIHHDAVTETTSYANVIEHLEAQKAVIKFAQAFNAAMDETENCTIGLDTAWAACQEAYATFLTDAANDLDYAKSLLNNATRAYSDDSLEACVERMMKTYEICVNTHGKTAFMSEFVTLGSAPRSNPINALVNGDNTMPIIVIVSLLSISAVGGYLFLRRRNEQ